MVKSIKKNWSLCFIVFYLLLVILYILFRGEDIIVTVHDNLDAWQGQYAAIKSGHLIFGKGSMPFMHGMDRDYFPSELKVYSWSYLLFDGFYAMVINYYLRVLLSIGGVAWLAKNILSTEEYDVYRNLIFLIGFLYAIIPVCPIWYIAVSVIPFTFAEIYRVCNHHFKSDIALLFLIPFFSELAHFGIFICAAILILLIFYTIRDKRFNFHLFEALIASSIGYVVSEYRMFRLLFIKHAVTIRVNRGIRDQSFITVIQEAKDKFLYSDSYVDSLQKYLILPLSVIYISYIFIKALKEKNIEIFIKNRVVQIIMFILINCFIYGLRNYQSFTDKLYRVFPVLKGFDFAKVVRFNAFFWYLILAILLSKLFKYGYKKLSYFLILISTLVAFLAPSTYNLIRVNVLREYNELKGISHEDSVGLSFSDFYSTELFSRIKEDIDYSGEWVAAYGMHPSILSYNDFATLDGYHSWYSDEYRIRFRGLIEPDFETDISHRDYFDFNAIRAYLYSDEVSWSPKVNLGVDEANLKIDKSVFRQLEGKYILSRVSITNSEDLDLVLRGIYTNNESPYTIYVYEMIYT